MKKSIFSLVLITLLSLPAFAESPLGSKKMASANRAASRILKEKMRNERPADAKLLDDVKSAEIIVVQGTYDRVEDVLGAVDIKHTLITLAQLESVELSAGQLLIINCATQGPSKETIAKIRRFVKAGGFLYTTDWALKYVVQRAFPTYVKWNGKSTKNDVVGIKIVKKDNMFLQNVNLSKGDPQWWLESSSYPIKVLDKKRVQVLIRSKEMKKKYGSEAIAVSFKFGEGQVLHIASHFYLQQNKLKTKSDRKKGEEWIADEANLSPGIREELMNDKDVRESSGGDIKSAYSSQQMTSNIVVETKRAQKKMGKLYNRRLNSKAEKKKGKSFKKGKRVRILKTRGSRVKVRTDSGDESWLDSEDLM